MAHETLADGCCSAITPCSHQQRDPSTICNVCSGARAADRRAATLVGTIGHIDHGKTALTAALIRLLQEDD